MIAYTAVFPGPVTRSIGTPFTGSEVTTSPLLLSTTAIDPVALPSLTLTNTYSPAGSGAACTGDELATGADYDDDDDDDDKAEREPVTQPT